MRTDIYLFEKGYASSRQMAQFLIKEGVVSIDGKKIVKSAQMIDETSIHEICIQSEICPYVSRGGLKLKKAIDAFKINVKEKIALDIGASTGGFTDCLLQYDAKKVWALDSGTAQLHDKLRKDSRVIVMENVNARYLSWKDFGTLFDIITLDVSFISQTLILPVVSSLLSDNGQFISLIKPQFEVGKEHVGKNGIVKETKLHRLAVLKVIAVAREWNLICTALDESPIKGGDGNTEFVALFEKKGLEFPADVFFKGRE